MPTTTRRQFRNLSTRRLHALADSYAGRFTETFHRSVMRLRSRLTNALIERDLARGLTGIPIEIYAAIDVGLALAKDAEEDVSRVFAELLGQVGSETYRTTFEGSFDAQSWRVQQVAHRLTADLVTNVNAETKKAIRQIIFEAIRDGIPPRSSREVPIGARDLIRQVVGLTSRDAAVLARYAELPNVTPKMVAARSEEMLRHRGENIARTETMRATNWGQDLAWEDAATDGMIDTRSTMRRWIVAFDDRLCPTCRPMANTTSPVGSTWTSSRRAIRTLPSGRKLPPRPSRSSFGDDQDLFEEALIAWEEQTADLAITPAPGRQGEVGALDYYDATEPSSRHTTVHRPPLHPSCRCRTILQRAEYGTDRSLTAGMAALRG